MRGLFSEQAAISALPEPDAPSSNGKTTDSGLRQLRFESHGASILPPYRENDGYDPSIGASSRCLLSLLTMQSRRSAASTSSAGFRHQTRDAMRSLGCNHSVPPGCGRNELARRGEVPLKVIPAHSFASAKSSRRGFARSGNAIGSPQSAHHLPLPKRSLRAKQVAMGDGILSETFPEIREEVRGCARASRVNIGRSLIASAPIRANSWPR